MRKDELNKLYKIQIGQDGYITQAIQRMTFTPNEITKTEWMEYYKKSLTEPIISYELAQNPHTPLEIIKELAYNAIQLNTLILLLERPKIDKDLLQKCIFPCIYEDKIRKLLDDVSQKREIIPQENIKEMFYYFQNKNPQIANKICEVISSEEFIKNIIDDEQVSEDTICAVVNNIYMPENIRNNAFDLGCDYLKINSPTPYMADYIYESVIQNIFYNDQSNKQEEEMRQNAINVLNELLEDNKLLSIPQQHLANLCENNFHKSYIYEMIYMNLIINTNKPIVLSNASVSRNKHIQQLTFYNANTPKHILQKSLDNHIAQLDDKNINKEDIFKLITSMLSKSTFKNETYEKILSQKYIGKKTLYIMAKSEFTPPDILKKLEKYDDKEIKFAATINNKMLKTGFLTNDSYEQLIKSVLLNREKVNVIYRDKDELQRFQDMAKSIINQIDDIQIRTNFKNRVADIINQSEFEIFKMNNTELFSFNKTTGTHEIDFFKAYGKTDNFIKRTLNQLNKQQLCLLQNSILKRQEKWNKVENYKYIDIAATVLELAEEQIEIKDKKTKEAHEKIQQHDERIR